MATTSIKVADIKRVAGNMFLGMFESIESFFTTTDSFEERVRIEWAKDKIPVYIPGKGFNISVDIDREYIVIDKKNFEDFRSILVNSIQKENNDIRNIEKFVKDFLKLETSSKGFLKQNKEQILNNTYPDNFILIEHGSFIHTFYDFKTINNSNQKIVESGLKIVEQISPVKAGISDNDIDDIIQEIEKIISSRFELTLLQKNVLKEASRYLSIALEGVPGAGKTTILAILLIIYFKILEKCNPEPDKKFTTLMVTNTYFAMKEFLEKLEQFLELAASSSFITDLHIYVGIPSDEDKKSEFSELIKRYKELEKKGIFIHKWQGRNNINNKSLKGRFNLIVFPLAKFRAYWGKVVNIESHIDILAIDEASQVSAISLIELFASMKNPPVRVVITGDTSQLPPVYSSGNTEIPLYSIGVLYNTFTFLDGRYKPLKLIETKRLKQSVVEILKDFYDEEISSIKQNIGNVQIVDDQLQKIFNKTNLAEIDLIRIKYIPDNPVSQRKSEDEKKIAEYIVKGIKASKIGIMTPFREQEVILKQINKDETLIIGTIDKLQGQDVDVAILSLAVSHPKYTQKVLPFITVPNRLNVALSRAKETNILIHSSTVEDEIFTAFDSEKIEKAREVIIGFKRFNVTINSEDKAAKYIKTIDSGKGYEMLREYIKKTERKIGELKIPGVNAKIEVYTS